MCRDLGHGWPRFSPDPREKSILKTLKMGVWCTVGWAKTRPQWRRMENALHLSRDPFTSLGTTPRTTMLKFSTDRLLLGQGVRCSPTRSKQGQHPLPSVSSLVIYFLFFPLSLLLFQPDFFDVTNWLYKCFFPLLCPNNHL